VMSPAHTSSSDSGLKFCFNRLPATRSLCLRLVVTLWATRCRPLVPTFAWLSECGTDRPGSPLHIVSSTMFYFPSCFCLTQTEPLHDDIAVVHPLK
jgi:hypothetical protein